MCRGNLACRAASGPPAPAATTRGELLSEVPRVASLAKRWLLGTHQGSVEEVRQGSYLNVFVFRFNRRREASERLAYYRVLELGAWVRNTRGGVLR